MTTELFKTALEFLLLGYIAAKVTCIYYERTKGMTRKHYKAIAASLRHAKLLPCTTVEADKHGYMIIDSLESAWIELFTKDNPTFQTQRFRDAAQL